MCSKGTPVEPPGPGVADSCEPPLWVLGRKPRFFAEAQVFLTIEPPLQLCVLLALLACVHVFQGLEQRHRICFAALHRYSTDGEVDLAVLYQA